MMCLQLRRRISRYEALETYLVQKGVNKGKTFHAAAQRACTYLVETCGAKDLAERANATRRLPPGTPKQWSRHARMQSPGNQRAPEQLLVTMRSMRNDIWATPCGDAGADTTVEAVSKRRCIVKTTRLVTDGHGLRKVRRGNPSSHRGTKPLDCSRHTYH